MYINLVDMRSAETRTNYFGGMREWPIASFKKPNMKTARRITFVCSLVLYASPLGAEETKAGLALPTAAPNLKITTEMRSQRVAKNGPPGKLGFLNRGGAIGPLLIAFGLVASV